MINIRIFYMEHVTDDTYMGIYMCQYGLSRFIMYEFIYLHIYLQ